MLMLCVSHVIFIHSSLGAGGGMGPANDQTGGSVEPIVPENDMTDEEITEMSIRAATFRNTDASIEEAYAVTRKDPPGKQEEEIGDFQ